MMSQFTIITIYYYNSEDEAKTDRPESGQRDRRLGLHKLSPFGDLHILARLGWCHLTTMKICSFQVCREARSASTAQCTLRHQDDVEWLASIQWPGPRGVWSDTEGSLD